MDPGCSESNATESRGNTSFRWCDQASLLAEYYESRKRERIHEDGSFMPHQKGPITLQTITPSFPSNAWIHKITKGKESNKCDLCNTLRIRENHFTSEADLPVQDLGHIQHTCEALSEAHTASHHRCWRLLHGELVRLACAEWRFMCISGEKNLETIWKELTEEFEEEFKWLNITTDSIWNTAREREIKRPFTQSELKLIAAGQTSESVAQTRFWRLRPDVLLF